LEHKGWRVQRLAYTEEVRVRPLPRPPDSSDLSRLCDRCTWRAPGVCYRLLPSTSRFTPWEVRLEPFRNFLLHPR